MWYVLIAIALQNKAAVSQRNTQKAHRRTSGFRRYEETKSRLQINSFSEGDQGNFALGSSMGKAVSSHHYVAASGQLHAPAVVPSVPFRFDARYRMIQNSQIQVSIILIYWLFPTTRLYHGINIDLRKRYVTTIIM